jgi:hypothetical protein
MLRISQTKQTNEPRPRDLKIKGKVISVHSSSCILQSHSELSLDIDHKLLHTSVCHQQPSIRFHQSEG